MTRIGIVIPYYGKFPNYFDLFLKSCGKNPTVDWLIFTDIPDPYDWPPNVHRIEMRFADLRALFQSRFDCPISLENAYKLCDYKPMTGYLFSDWLTEYDYWGYSDVDMLFGDIRKFLPDEKITRYDKIGHLGHLTLYRNDPEINTLFMQPIGGKTLYQEVLAAEHTVSFTEWYQININSIFVAHGKRVWFCNDFFDVDPNNDNFHRTNLAVEYGRLEERKRTVDKEDTFASWENGRVYQWRRADGGWVKQEFLYVHFQKRKMEVCIDPKTADRFLCVPDQFVPYADEIPQEYVKRSEKMGRHNHKYWKHWRSETKYRIIVLTSPIRHPVRTWKNRRAEG